MDYFADAAQNLIEALIRAVVIAVQFLWIAILGFLVACFYLLPWLLRIGGLLISVYGISEMVMAVNAIYAIYTEPTPLFALYVFVITIQISLVFLIAMLNTRLIWGATYFAGALSLWTTKSGIPLIWRNWEHADLFFRVLPPLLFVVFFIYLTLRGRLKRRPGWQPSKISMLVPALVENALGKADAFSISIPAFNQGEGVATDIKEESASE